MASSHALSFRVRTDSPTERPKDLAFDRPEPEELMDVAWDVVEDLDRAGFTADEMRAVVEAMETVVETRRNGNN